MASSHLLSTSCDAIALSTADGRGNPLAPRVCPPDLTSVALLHCRISIIPHAHCIATCKAVREHSIVSHALAESFTITVGPTSQAKLMTAFHF